jgi:hypothetical protein
MHGRCRGLVSHACRQMLPRSLGRRAVPNRGSVSRLAPEPPPGPFPGPQELQNVPGIRCIASPVPVHPFAVPACGPCPVRVFQVCRSSSGRSGDGRFFQMGQTPWAEAADERSTWGRRVQVDGIEGKRGRARKAGSHGEKRCMACSGRMGAPRPGAPRSGICAARSGRLGVMVSLVARPPGPTWKGVPSGRIGRTGEEVDKKKKQIRRRADQEKMPPARGTPMDCDRDAGRLPDGTVRAVPWTVPDVAAADVPTMRQFLRGRQDGRPQACRKTPRRRDTLWRTSSRALPHDRCCVTAAQ